MKLSHRTILACLTLFAAANAAHAALFDDEEARKRIDATNQRLSSLQRQVEDRLALLEQQAKSGAVADLATQIQLLQGDIAKLRGQIEVVTYELEQSQKRQRDLYVDLDTRLRKIESAGAAASAPPDANAAAVVAPPGGPAAPPATAPGPAPSVAAATPPPRTANDGVAEQRAYDAALDLFKRGDYQGAINGFGSFVKAYPRSPLVASAQYWIGNAQYAKRDYRASIATQRQLLKEFSEYL